MYRKIAFFLGVAFGVGVTVHAQTIAPCATDQHHEELLKRFPQIAATQAQLEQNIRQQIDAYVQTLASRGTNAAWETICGYAGDTYEFDIPVVVHIIHNYGAEYISDDKVYQMIKDMNIYYHKLNADTVNIIKPFKEYAGKARITFHLAAIDPTGQPTNGITRRYSYLTYGGDELAKMDQWSSDRYMNIWAEQRIGVPIDGGIVAAYSRFPADGRNDPNGDGIIANALFIGDNGTTISHEAGHFFNLLHPWNSNGRGAGEGPECGDDAVDDTPPTIGHFAAGAAGCPLYDTVCATGYQKSYGPFGNATVIDFPDTVNTQNIMDYSNCTNMFTVGQIARMRATLRDSIVSRYKLASDENLIRTGVFSDINHTPVPRPDLSPIADFSVNRNFVCANTTIPSVQFTDRSWRDTIASRSWTFSNGSPSTNTSSGPSVTFSQPGWVNATLTATGNNTGSNTISRSDLVYAADPNAISPNGYFQEFDQSSTGDVSMYPIFNYYGLADYRWELSNYGAYDHSGIMFHNYDSRPTATEVTRSLSPGGNYADFFTRAFDLSGSQFTSTCNLTFFSAGAYRVVNPAYMNDTLQISYSTDCGNSWHVTGNITSGSIANRGLVSTPFYPAGLWDWKLNGLPVPTLARTAKVFFRFRFLSGTDNATFSGFPWGTGNNFFLDRINITSNAVGVNAAELLKNGMTLYPNPTNSSETVSLSGGDNSLAQINVTDVAGKTIYHTEVRLTSTVTQVEIPARNIAVRGLYLVHVVSNGTTQTQKLVVY